MRKLPVAGEKYDHKLENIRNDIIEQELGLALKKNENVYLDENVQIKYTTADGTVYTFGEVTASTVALESDVTVLQADYTTLSGSVSTNATAISGLEVRVTDNEGDITSLAVSVTSLQTSLTTAEGNIAANSSAINTLQSEVSTIDGTVTALASDVTSLSSTVTNIQTNVTANAGAISSLDTRVTSTEGSITAISSDVTTLTTTVGTNTASISTNASSINGIEGKYSVKIDNNGYVSGFGLISTANNATPLSVFTITADAFEIVNPAGTSTPVAPFSVYTSPRTIGGVTYPAGTYIENAYIDNAAIVNLSADKISAGTLNVDRLPGLVYQERHYNPTLYINTLGVSRIVARVNSFLYRGGDLLITYTNNAAGSYGSINIHYTTGTYTVGATSGFGTAFSGTYNTNTASTYRVNTVVVPAIGLTAGVTYSFAAVLNHETGTDTRADENFLQITEFVV